MTHDPFEETLRKIAQLTPNDEQEPPAPEAVHSATEFVEAVRAALAPGDAPWQVPIVEVGGGGAVVLLWQDNQRMLSLVTQAQGGTHWFYDPGAPLGYLNLADASDLLTQGAATPADFARHVWPVWVRGDNPAPSSA